MLREPKNTDASDVASALEALTTLEDVIVRARTEVDGLVAPVRQSFFKRYPTLFLFLTTTGVTAVFLGLERILLEIPLLEEKPWLLFFVGVGILAITGRLYKKLG
jgi:hypothetical protein